MVDVTLSIHRPTLSWTLWTMYWAFSATLVQGSLAKNTRPFHICVWTVLPATDPLGGPNSCDPDPFLGILESNSPLPVLLPLENEDVVGRGGDSERARLPLGIVVEVFVVINLLCPINGLVLADVAATVLGWSASNDVSTSGGSIDTLIHPVGVRDVLRFVSFSASVERSAAIWNCF